jgi:hypothetical protein
LGSGSWVDSDRSIAAQGEISPELGIGVSLDFHRSIASRSETVRRAIAPATHKNDENRG